MWGHYTSKEHDYAGNIRVPHFIQISHLTVTGYIPDPHLSKMEKMYLYYTGNVKLEDGEYDYIRTGREGNTVLVMTEDGKTFGRKKN